ncbi:DUF779 domain-containing protein [Cellulomonas sp. JH27-2]|nr:DUF779 domain-containing protein [Cellulomonas sp. JH27-2]
MGSEETTHDESTHDESRGAGAVPERVAVTDAAAQMLRSLRDQHGELMIHQSGGCCDGSSPMCYPAGDFLTGDVDEHLGDLDLGDGVVVPVWMTKAQYEYWKHTHLTIDVVPGRGAGFSLEAPEGVRFLIRSRLLTDDEFARLQAAGVL